MMSDFIINDELQDLVDRLKELNAWRRGADTEMPHPKVIGQDIDSAIKFIESHIKSSVIKNPKTRNSYGSVVNKIMSESQLTMQTELRREVKLTWQEIDVEINKIK